MVVHTLYAEKKLGIRRWEFRTLSFNSETGVLSWGKSTEINTYTDNAFDITSHEDKDLQTKITFTDGKKTRTFKIRVSDDTTQERDAWIRAVMTSVYYADRTRIQEEEIMASEQQRLKATIVLQRMCKGFLARRFVAKLRNETKLRASCSRLRDVKKKARENKKAKKKAEKAEKAERKQRLEKATEILLGESLSTSIDAVIKCEGGEADNTTLFVELRKSRASDALVIRKKFPEELTQELEVSCKKLSKQHYGFRNSKLMKRIAEIKDLIRQNKNTTVQLDDVFFEKNIVFTLKITQDDYYRFVDISYNPDDGEICGYGIVEEDDDFDEEVWAIGPDEKTAEDWLAEDETDDETDDDTDDETDDDTDDETDDESDFRSYRRV